MSWKNEMSKDDKKWFNDHFDKKGKYVKKYKLTFHKEVLISNVPFPICVAKRNEMLKTGDYTNEQHLFRIERDWEHE